MIELWRGERQRAAALGAGVIALGLISRATPVGVPVWDAYLGDALYAVLIFLGLTVMWPASATGSRAAAAATFVTAIELFQLTPIPAALNRHDALPVRLFAALVLGSGFNWWDLLAYAVGIAAVVAIDRRI